MSGESAAYATHAVDSFVTIFGYARARVRDTHRAQSDARDNLNSIPGMPHTSGVWRADGRANGRVNGRAGRGTGRRLGGRALAASILSCSIWCDALRGKG